MIMGAVNEITGAVKEVDREVLATRSAALLPYDPPRIISEKQIPAVTRGFQNTAAFLASSTVNAARR
jgi:hypothetical protein